MFESSSVHNMSSTVDTKRLVDDDASSYSEEESGFLEPPKLSDYARTVLQDMNTKPSIRDTIEEQQRPRVFGTPGSQRPSFTATSCNIMETNNNINTHSTPFTTNTKSNVWRTQQKRTESRIDKIEDTSRSHARLVHFNSNLPKTPSPISHKRQLSPLPKHSLTNAIRVANDNVNTQSSNGEKKWPARKSLDWNKENDYRPNYDTPERSRKAMVPLSSSKMNARFSLQPKPESLWEQEKRFEERLQTELKMQKEQLQREFQEQLTKLSHEEVRSVHVNGNQYFYLEQIGRGGTSKVYRAKMRKSSEIYAIKVVDFEQFDDEAVNGFKREIEILERLRDQQRVVKLFDYSLSDESLFVVMECGDVDLAHVLIKRSSLPMDISFVRHVTSEMLKCVQSVHSAGVIHSDLKPANFLFVKGVLKIIDFGISNAVSEYTVNIHREAQIGTPNYMAPETLTSIDQESGTLWKVGKPADVWSCGCIIYQIVYGRPPYAAYSGQDRYMAIVNKKVQASYPGEVNGVKVPANLIEMMQGCLQKDPCERSTIDQLLMGDFLQPKIVSERFISGLVQQSVQYGVQNPRDNGGRLQQIIADVWRRIVEHNGYQV